MKKIIAGAGLVAMLAVTGGVASASTFTADDSSNLSLTNSMKSIRAILNHTQVLTVGGANIATSNTGNFAISAGDEVNGSTIGTGQAEAVTGSDTLGNDSDTGVNIDATMDDNHAFYVNDSSTLTENNNDEEIEAVDNNTQVSTLLDSSASTANSGNVAVSAGDEVNDFMGTSAGSIAGSVTTRTVDMVMSRLNMIRRSN